MEEPIEPSLDEKTASHNDAAHADDEKKKAILEACSQRDLDALRALAESRGGFLTDSIRQQACKCFTALRVNLTSSLSPRADTPGTPAQP
jgi:hypothetical protein